MPALVVFCPPAKEPGGCFNKHIGPSDQAMDHHPVLFVHSRMVWQSVVGTVRHAY